MTPDEIAGRVRSRLVAADIERDDLVEELAAYLGLLGKWNRRINLTAFDLDALTDHAIDRLIVEPVVAAREIAPEDRITVDIGSGGGSPALPLKIAAPWLEMTLLEARERKCAFLREAARTLRLANVAVESARFGTAGYPSLNGAVDVITMRAVRADPELWRGVTGLARPGGRLLWFREREGAHDPDIPAGWSLDRTIEAGTGVVSVFNRQVEFTRASGR